jgi:hypothetical protein
MGPVRQGELLLQSNNIVAENFKNFISSSLHSQISEKTTHVVMAPRLIANTINRLIMEFVLKELDFIRSLSISVKVLTA